MPAQETREPVFHAASILQLGCELCTLFRSGDYVPDMEHPSYHTARVLTLDLLVLILCATNIPPVMNRARLPASLDHEDMRTVVRDVDDGPGSLQIGDILLEWDGISVGRPEHAEFLADLSHIGQTIHLTVDRNGSVFTIPASLTSYSPSFRFAVVYSLTGFVILAIALSLLLKRPDESAARALHDALIGLGALTLLTQGAIDAADPLSYLHRAGLFAAYALTPALFLRWTMIFPFRRFGPLRWPRVAIPTSALFFAVMLSLLHLAAMTTRSAATFDAFQELYEWFHLYFAVVIAAALWFLVAGYFRETEHDRRAALRWILWGALIGATPFTLFVVLPQAFGLRILLPEELGLLFVLALPLCLTVAFLRYHVFHVRVHAYQRLASIVVGLMTSGVAILASLVLVSLAWEDTVFNVHLDVALAVAVSMVLFQPARAMIRRVLDESLFPVRSQLARVLQRAASRFRTAMSPDQLGTFLIEEIEEAIPGLTFDWARAEANALTVIPRSSRQDTVSVHLPPAIRANLQPRTLVAVDGVVEGSRTVDPAVGRWLRDQDADLALGLHNEKGVVLAVVLGRWRQRRRSLASEETEALTAIASAADESLGRLYLQERMILEQQERRRSDELSRLKSHFVSSVSHDLRTPLTSISMFGEMLEDRRLPAAKRTEYAGIIVREADRLGRMVSNVLNFAKIERGSRDYDLKELDPASVVRSAVKTIEVHAKAFKAVVRTKVPRQLPLIRGDADALQDVLINLIGNALKYSPPPRRVWVEAKATKTHVELRVRDRGIGIPPEDLPRLFEPFYRGKDPAVAQVGGAGLGLALAKHAIDAHGGTVTVERTLGRGTTVTVRLPHNRRSTITDRQSP